MKPSRTARCQLGVSAGPPMLWLALFCAFSSLTAFAADPAWWSVHGAVNASSTPAPYAVVNEGQLKQFTVCAVQELNGDLAGGAGTTLNQLVSGWQTNYVHNNPIDFRAVNIGQLKQIASLIYAQLQQYGYAAPTWLTYNPTTQYDLV